MYIANFRNRHLHKSLHAWDRCHFFRFRSWPALHSTHWSNNKFSHFFAMRFLRCLAVSLHQITMFFLVVVVVVRLILAFILWFAIVCVYTECVFELHCLAISIAEFNQEAIFVCVCLCLVLSESFERECAPIRRGKYSLRNKFVVSLLFAKWPWKNGQIEILVWTFNGDSVTEFDHFSCWNYIFNAKKIAIVLISAVGDILS